jgi:hypothetical protein
MAVPQANKRGLSPIDAEHANAGPGSPLTAHDSRGPEFGDAQKSGGGPGVVLAPRTVVPVSLSASVTQPPPIAL